jgi:hypothetical protein
MDDTNLKPCPFCGEPPTLERLAGPSKRWAVQCVNPRCGVAASTLEARSQPEAEKLWNQRAHVRSTFTAALATASLPTSLRVSDAPPPTGRPLLLIRDSVALTGRQSRPRLDVVTCRADPISCILHWADFGSGGRLSDVRGEHRYVVLPLSVIGLDEEDADELAQLA